MKKKLTGMMQGGGDEMSAATISLTAHFELYLLCRWLIAYITFIIFYRSANFLLMQPSLAYFDLSGHVMCAMTSYSMWAILIAFIYDLHKKPKNLNASGQNIPEQNLDSQIKNEKETSFLISDKNQVRSSGYMPLILCIAIIGIFCTCYQLYSIFFTCYAYHSVFEVFIGYLCGFIITTTLQNSTMSDSLYVIAHNLY